MKVISRIIQSAIVSILAFAANAHTADANSEKCYGIVKAGMNDCQTHNTSCASSATKDKQPDAFVFVPKGLCEKIVDGSLTPKEK